jgi:hypothetical protein
MCTGSPKGNEYLYIQHLVRHTAKGDSKMLEVDAAVGKITELRIISAQTEDLDRYLDLLEEAAAWLEKRGIGQWPVGSFRVSADYYAESIKLREVQLASHKLPQLSGIGPSADESRQAADDQQEMTACRNYRDQ